METFDFYYFCSAARTGNINALQNCLDAGINIHACNDIALRYAVEYNHAEAVIFLLENGADIHSIDNHKLRNSALYGDIPTVQNLLEKGSCNQEAKIYALYNAILAGHTEIVKLFLENDICILSNNYSILNFCTNEEIISLFEDYLK